MYVLPGVEIPTNNLDALELEGKGWVRKIDEFKEIFCRCGVPGEDDDVKYQLAFWASDCELEIL